MHISLFYCVQVFIYTHFFCSHTARARETNMFRVFLLFFCVVVVDMHDVVHKCSLCKFCIFNSVFVLRNETMAQGIINLGTLFCIAGKTEREKCKSNGYRIYGDSVNIMNEYFQQLKCKKEGLCVYAVLRVNLFIALCSGKESRKTAFFTHERLTEPQKLRNFPGS
jgi:hypothetical protein